MVNYVRRFCGDTGAVIGELTWEERPGKVFELHLDVREDFRRQGVGRFMVEDVEKVARFRGGVSLTTAMASDNALATQFFQGIGFELTFVKDYYGQGRHAYIGVKHLRAP